MAASESTLGELHEQVAKALTEQVVGYTETLEDGSSKIIRPSPALLGAAIAYLKNNNITADAEDNEALKNLTAKLKERRNKRTSQASLDAAADDFANRFGGGHLQ